jgi:hypothetical protein
MNKARPYSLSDIIDLGPDDLPKQIWRLNEPNCVIGSAFKTLEEATDENPHRHTARITIYDVDGKPLFT